MNTSIQLWTPFILWKFGNSHALFALFHYITVCLRWWYGLVTPFLRYWCKVAFVLHKQHLLMSYRVMDLSQSIWGGDFLANDTILFLNQMLNFRSADLDEYPTTHSCLYALLLFMIDVRYVVSGIALLLSGLNHSIVVIDGILLGFVAFR